MKILVVSEFTGLGSTGYSAYYKEICSALHNAGHSVVELASYGNSNNINHVKYKNKCKWKVILNIPPANHPDMKLYSDWENKYHNAKFGAWAFEIICAQEQPDVVLAVRDHWYDEFIVRSPASKYYVSVLSPTVDAMPQQAEWIDTFGRADIITTYNEWSQRWLQQQYKCENLVSYISPSVSDEYKILDKTACRNILGNHVPAGCKLVGTVMRNQKRKRFPDLFEAIRDSPNVYLHCHTAYPDKGWNIPSLILANGIQDRVFLTYMCPKCGHVCAKKYSTRFPICVKCSSSMKTPDAQNGISQSEMAKIYGSLDLYIQPVNSEGFGIPLIESAKCGIRCTTTDYSAQVDVLRKVDGIPMKPLSLDLELETGCYRAVVDKKLLVDVLKDPESYNYKKEDIRAKFDENYSWDKTSKKWVDLIGSIKPKNLWNFPMDIKNPVSFEDLSKLNLDNEKYILYCILNVAFEPKLLGSYMHTNLLDNLNGGVRISSRDDGLITPVDRKYVYNVFREMIERKNTWENQRSQLNQQLKKN